MESTIKQAEEERNRALDSAKHLYDEFKPLKEHVDNLRSNIGLEKLPNLEEEEEKLTPEYVLFTVLIIFMPILFKILNRVECQLGH
jgi:chromosome segregation ATPase